MSALIPLAGVAALVLLVYAVLAWVRPGWLDLAAFTRALLPMLITWSAWVLLATLGGYPGVICVTPMAWLMALWSGRHYAALTAGRAGRWPLLGPALVGAVLGLCLGMMFAGVNAATLAVGLDADEAARAWVLAGLILAVSVPVCAALSAVTAWLVYRSAARAAPG